ncbi:zinc finger protein 395-like [Boleophthalmus pectinirostris]|uniref:zinc finger protein 395-like n=1 Tax=Boleophthalmus pectinirostris TaxID=150288 RepID=UPI00242B7B8C|nr:zinc finger protein 395-like [Boleophthalmus pectinirostris]XP_055019128.1 zinc finger protein 395-like [Boleophthalmus pectinirostris]
MFPKTRLGKRSPFGALLNSACPPTVRHDQESHSEQVKLGFTVSQCEAEHSENETSNCSRLMSSSIDVPKSRHQEVDMDELMAAMVLSSLSCSPLLHSPAQPEPSAAVADCGGELSDCSSGYWSVGHSRGSPAASPPITEPDGDQTTTSDEGMELELFEEPAPRRRRNSEHASFRCLWPGCEKVLTSIVGIKRHVRTMHLNSCGGEYERCSRSEEDFYYTEITQSQTTPPQCTPASPTHQLSSPACSSPPPSSPALSSSAPSSSSGAFWQVQVEHSYQAPPPVLTAAVPSAACHWTTPSSTHNKQALHHRVRSVSVGEQWLQQSAPCRRVRGEAKKCRKVYGIEHREQWCTACRWKKACQRFLD